MLEICIISTHAPGADMQALLVYFMPVQPLGGLALSPSPLAVSDRRLGYGGHGATTAIGAAQRTALSNFGNSHGRQAAPKQNEQRHDSAINQKYECGDRCDGRRPEAVN